MEQRSYLQQGMTNCLHGGLYSADNKSVKIDFSSNVNPLGASKKVLNVVKKKLDKLISLYPDPKYDLVCKKISDYFFKSILINKKIYHENIKTFGFSTFGTFGLF